LSGVVGLNFHVNRFFRFFVEGREIAGRHLGSPTPINLGELRMSAGLGYQLTPR